jgi:hypothetical protein
VYFISITQLQLYNSITQLSVVQLEPILVQTDFVLIAKSRRFSSYSQTFTNFFRAEIDEAKISSAYNNILKHTRPKWQSMPNDLTFATISSMYK